MFSVADFSRSMNETHRICTHDISGHLHLLRFCMDEISERDGRDIGDLLSRLDEGLLKLEELNRLLKVCTRYFNPEEDVTLASLCEKSIGLVTLYHQKFIEEITYTTTGSLNVDIGNAVYLIDGIFGIGSTIAHFAAIEGVSHLHYEITSGNEEIYINANVPNVTEEKVNELLKTGNENDKTLRRAYSHELFSQSGGRISYHPDKASIEVRIKL